MFNLSHVFASLMQNILFWRKMKLSWSHTDAKKVTSYISTSKAAGDNTSKLKKRGALTSLKWVHEMTVISECTCLRVVFVSGIPHNSRRDWSIYFNFVALPINSRFICWCCWFVFISLWNNNKSYVHFLRKRQWKWNLKSMKMGWIRMTVKLEKSVW